MERSNETAALDFDTWAGLSAQLLHRDMDERIDILDERGVTLEDWTSSDDHYARLLVADIAAGRMERPNSYGRKCAAEIQRRKQPAHTPHEATDTQAGAALEPEPATPAPAPEATVPTLLQEPLTTSARVAPPRELTSTLAAESLPSFIKQSAPKPLPFGGTPSAEFLAGANAPKPVPTSSVGATIGVNADLMSQVRAALPFAPPDDVTQKPSLAAVGETKAVDAALLVQAAKMLPFPTSAGAGTKPSQATFPRLPLQTYASLCVELSLFPDRATEVSAKYGVSNEAARHALDRDWESRFSAYPETRQEWEQACTTYRDWLRRQPR
ncbi:hypothetical protein A7982_12991 [Minicystis rosea]|nr:hypothetical protein A7982_12991 [Minicystis rosea]